MWMPELVKWTSFFVAFLLYAGKESFASFTPVDNYLVACGSSKNITFQGRTFIADTQHSKLDIKTNKNSDVVTSKFDVPSPVYQSARVFSGNASYVFRVEQKGRHWIRLYFYPLPFLNHNLTSASITVVTDNFVLLNNFTFMNYSGSYLFKEYAINITSHELSLRFIPYKNSLVFVNAIEVVSVHDKIFPDLAMDLNPYGPFSGLTELALETVHRLNVGGASLSAQNDTLGRSWENDEIYFHNNSAAINISTNTSAVKYSAAVPPRPPVIAPPVVYATAKAMRDASVESNSNMSWVFSVDPNFRYFVRFHFCDFISRPPNTMAFDVYINIVVALPALDLTSVTRYLAVPYHKDFISNGTVAGTLTVSVGHDGRTHMQNAILNGVEIMKISNAVGSLDGFSSVESFLPKSSQTSGKLVIIIGCSICVLISLVLIGRSVCYLISRRSRARSAATSQCLRRFTLQEIQEATNYFEQDRLLGEGGFGKVYRGTLENGTTVAIKAANAESRQGANEFHNEIELLSGLCHKNLVSLIGYCNEDSEMILVYNYMANGSLSSHLHGTGFVPLSWKQRLQICIGAAKGLHYLHTGAKQSIIHRDVKTANILLDENLVPKLADFGISKKGPPLEKSHVTTNVKGSFGYVDPEYFKTKFLTEKSDVYSFGLVLIEVICGKPALDDARPTEQINLALWALSSHEKGNFHEMIDPSLIGKVNMDSLNKVSKLAWKCLKEDRANRPPMGYALCELEEALHLELASSPAV